MPLSDVKRLISNKCPHYAIIGDITIPIGNNLIPNNRLRKIFIDMIHRCYDINDKAYKNYGNKNIKISQEWLDNPKLFFEWSMLNGYKNNLTIDRINENDDYKPNNCRWVNRSDNSRFKSNTNYITATVTLSGRQWASLIPEHNSNYINKKLRENGLEQTIEYIENRLSDKRLLNNTDI